jgi:hypothetical protein
MENNVEKGFVRISKKGNDSLFFDSKILNEKECIKIIKDFKNSISENQKFLELYLMSGATILIMVDEISHIIYIPESIMNRNKEDA